MTHFIDEEQYLAHYGILRRSGRYPWGSGENQNQRNRMFLDFVDDLKKQGLSEVDVAKAISTEDQRITTTKLRALKSIAKAEQKQAKISEVQRLKDRGWSNMEISRRTGLPEPTVRNYLKPGAADRAQVLDTTVEILRDQVEKKKYLEVGPGTEHQLGISRGKMKNAIAKLEEEGYKQQYLQFDQLSTPHKTTMTVLTKADVDYKTELWPNRFKIQQISVYSDDGGRTFFGIKPPTSINLKRVAVRYGEDGGGDADGVIYVRPGVDDVALGKSRYAQVRISVNGSHYLKGMAVYKDDLPPGVDLMFNTPKSNTGNKLDAMKPLKRIRAEGDPKDSSEWTGPIDEDNPFGSVIKRQHGVMNILDEEGSWLEWSKTLSSQFLSKQTPKFAKQQLDVTTESLKREHDEIMSLTNPSVRQHLLEDFALRADSAAVHLKAAGMPRQASHVILPVPSMKPSEVYAPNHNDGDRVVLVRHPHGGIFEIPELVVNNQHRAAKKIIGKNAIDAVGIHPSVAKKLSGADFDGDTVLVIPNDKGSVKTSPSLKGLPDFDPISAYPAYEGMPKLTTNRKDALMGDISNLITDMTIKGASQEELARAVRHSMVVIDAEKKHLNYKLSAQENGIKALKSKYQGGATKGASTIVSRKKRQVQVPHRKQTVRTDPQTGKRVYTPSGESWPDKRTGETVYRKIWVNELDEADDAFALTSGGSRKNPGTEIEMLYANHSNTLKGMANTARLEALNTKLIRKSTSAAETYRPEVASLNSKLNVAKANAPRERAALVVANAVLQQKKQANPDMEKDEEKKVKFQALAEARTRTGARKEQVVLTPREWEAIQAGAISPSKLSEILKNSDIDQVKKLATPRTPRLMTSTKMTRAKAMLAKGFTQAEVASQLGVSLTTLKDALS